MSREAGKLAGIYCGAKKGGGKTAVETGELILGHGLEGDSHAGRDAYRQVSLFAAEVLRDLQTEGFAVTSEQLSANLFTEHFPLDALEPGARLRIGETELEIVERRLPCRSITRIDHRLPKRLYGRCGQLARIIKSGLVYIGDEIRVAADENQMALEFGSDNAT